jgi:hypothetical protein
MPCVLVAPGNEPIVVMPLILDSRVFPTGERCVSKVDADCPTRVVERLDGHAIRVLPLAIALSAVPALDAVKDVTRRHVAKATSAIASASDQHSRQRSGVPPFQLLARFKGGLREMPGGVRSGCGFVLQAEAVYR